MQEKVAKTFFDEGFELTEKPTFLNEYNIDGTRCESCDIALNCALKESGAVDMCFDSFRRQYRGIVNGLVKGESNLNRGDIEFNSYVRNIAYHLERSQNIKKHEIDNWDSLDVLHDVCLSTCRNIIGKRRVICRILGRQTLDVLRSRGYEM